MQLCNCEELFNNFNQTGYRESLCRRFTKSEIQNIISNSTIIGKGGFGEVHRGTLNNTEVAVKVLASSSSQGSDEFQNEV